MSNSIEITDIMALLPHRFPFLLVDRVTDFEPFSYIKGYKQVSINEPFFQGHFPGQPILPGVLILESMAQCCGILYGKSYTPPEGKKFMYYFGGVNNAKFKHMVVPGDRLDLKVTVMKHKSQFWKMQGEAFVGDDLACSAELTCVTKEVDCD